MGLRDTRDLSFIGKSVVNVRDSMSVKLNIINHRNNDRVARILARRFICLMCREILLHGFNMSRSISLYAPLVAVR